MGERNRPGKEEKKKKKTDVGKPVSSVMRESAEPVVIKKAKKEK